MGGGCGYVRWWVWLCEVECGYVRWWVWLCGVVGLVTRGGEFEWSVECRCRCWIIWYALEVITALL